MALHGTLPEFSGNDWSSYVDRMGFYFETNDIDIPKRRAILLSVVGNETYTLLRSLAASRAPGELTFEELCTLLAAHFEPKPNAILQRYNFYSAYRTQRQPIKDFVADLKNLARNCEFGKTKPGVQLTEQLILEENLRDRLVCGVADTVVQRRLLSETDLDFAKAFQIALAMESATANAAQLCSTGQERSPEGAEVNKIISHGQAARRSEPEPQYNAQTCFRCGDPSHSPNECRFRYAECRYCKKTGHIQSNCFTKKTADKRKKGNRAHHMTPSDNYEAQHVAHEQPGGDIQPICIDRITPGPNRNNGMC